MRAPEWLRTIRAGAVGMAGNRFLAVLLLTLLALGLRLIRLTYQPLWWDEGWSLYFATTNAGHMLELTAVDIHPPLYYLLLHGWIRLFGPGVVSVRLLSVLIGTATIPLLYAVGRRLSGHRGGLLAAFLLAISPLHIYYSQEVRMYGLVTLLGVLALASTIQWEAEAGEKRFGPWAGYVLAATAALYTVYYAAFLLLALNLYVLIRWLRAKRPLHKLAAWLGAQLAVLLLFLPWLWYAGPKLFTYVQFKVSVEGDPSFGFFAYLARHLAAFTWGHAEGWLAAWWWAGLLPLVALLLALGIVLWRRRSDGVGGGNRSQEAGDAPASHLKLAPALPLTILIVTLACGFVVNLVLPFNPPRSERLLLLALPAYLMLLAMGLIVVARPRRWLAAATLGLFVVAALVSLGFYYTVPRYPDDDYRPLVERVRVLGLPSDAVLCVHPWQAGYFEAYIPDDARPALVLTPREVLPRERQLWADDPALMAVELDRLLEEHGRLWFPDHRAMGRVLEEEIEGYLVEHSYPVLDEWYGENTVLSFFAAGEPAAQPVTAQFGDWLSLEGAALSPGPLEAGWGVAAVDLAWQLSEQPAEDYAVGLRLVGAAGYIWAQRDADPEGGLEPFAEWPAGETQIDRHGLLVPAGTPPGEYTLTLRVYHSRDLDVLPVTFAGGSGGEVALGQVRVTRPETPPPVEALDFAQPLQVDFDDRLRLVGANVPAETASFLPGEAVPVDLFWQAQADPGQDYYPRLRLLDAQDSVVAELVEKPVAGTYPTAWWRAGELVRDPHALPIPATVPPGSYRLAAGLVRADGSEAEAARGQTAVDLGQIQVEGREHNFEPTEPEHAQAAQLGTSVEMTGYDLREVVRAPGSPLEVTLHWHALETPARAYYTFVHLLDADGAILAQDDGPPGGGEIPMMGWLPGEYVTDTRLLRLPPGLTDGEYHLGVGFYDPVTGLRLGDRVILDTAVPVSAAEGCQCP